VVIGVKHRRSVRIGIDADGVTVIGRRGRHTTEEVHPAVGADRVDAVLRTALRSSVALRAGAPCDLTIVWDPARILLRVEPHPVRADSTIASLQDRLTTIDPEATVAIVDLPPGDESVLCVMVPTVDVERLATALHVSRVEGRATLDLGVLVRARGVLARVSPHVEGRRGAIVDVSASIVVVMAFDGTVLRSVQVAPRADVRGQVVRMLAAALERPVAGVGRAWLSIHADPRESVDLRRACAAALPPDAAIDLLRHGAAGSPVTARTSRRSRRPRARPTTVGPGASR
jgi:hypothetical protein